MKLSTKLIVSFSTVIIFVGGIGFTSSYFNEAVKDQVTAESDRAIQEVKLAGELGLHLFKSLTRTQYLLEDSYRESLSMSYSRSKRTKKVQIAEVQKSLDGFSQNLNELRALVKSTPPNVFEHAVDSSEVFALLDNLEKKYRNYAALLTQFQNIDGDNYQDRKEFFTVTIEPYFRTNLLPSIEELRNQIQENHQQEINELNSQLDTISLILLGATFGALIIAIVLVLYIYQSIANPISKISRTAQNIGQGNLQDRINYDSSDELGQLSRTVDQMAENLSKTTVSRDYVDSIIRAMADLLVVTDQDFSITRVNSAASAMLDYSEQELLDKPVNMIFKEIPGEILETENSHQKQTYTCELTGKNEKVTPVSISRGTIKDKDGDVTGYVFVATDISAEKEAQQKISESLREKEVLLAEVHHRVKNNLAVISGLLQMQMWESENEDAKSALQQSHLRVQSIALVHEKLYQSETLSYVQFDRYLLDLMETIEEVYLVDEADIKIESNVKTTVLNVNQAIPCALLINELVINAFKYAFEDAQKGTIEVHVNRRNHWVWVKVSDNGSGFVEAGEDKDSLELTLVNTLAKQLNGELNIYNDNGAHIEFRFIPEDISAN